MAAIVAVIVVGAAPGSARAFGVSALSLKAKVPTGAATQPALTRAPGRGGHTEWFVATNSKTAVVRSISRSGRLTRVTTKLPAGVGTIPGNAGAEPSYGAAVLDGYDWLVKYGQDTSPLYAITPSGKVIEVSRDVGEDVADMTVGAGHTLNFASNLDGVISCRVSTEPAVSCARFSVATLPRFSAGLSELEAIASDGGRLWFTDYDGELGAFNLTKELTGGTGSVLSKLFAGPFGDTGRGISAVGEASADPHTIAADANGYLYVAGGELTSKHYQNDELLKVAPKGGKTVKTYRRGLNNVTAVTSGPGDSVWFLNRTSATGGKVGELNVHTDKISERTLPVGFKFGPYISEISAGPAGSRKLYFTLETKSGAAAIGQVTGA